MDMDKTIGILIIGIAGCILAIIIMAITDLVKSRKKSKVSGNDKASAEPLDDKKPIETKETVAVKSVSQENEDYTKSAEISDKSSNNKSDNSTVRTVGVTGLNPPPVKIEKSKETEKIQEVEKTQETDKASDFLPTLNIGSDAQSALYALLQSIAVELKSRATKTDKVVLNYLKDGMPEAEIQNGYFMTRNEELSLNGEFFEDADVWDIPANSRINIRFCLNIAVPDGYTMFVEPIADLLASKGLEAVHVTMPASAAMSIRVDLISSRPCTISKDECLFKIKVMKEVAQW